MSLHAQNRNNFLHFKNHHAYEIASKFKEEGRIKHLGISFHDTADILDQILTEYPQIEVVQIQYNYLDYEDDVVQSRKCYEVCAKHDKRVIVMEPIKGGSLINLPPEGKALLEEANLSPANLALRFAASPKHMFMVLSGMSTLEQMEENVTFMKDMKPVNEEEIKLSQKIAKIIKGERLIGCTACKYCVDGCPMQILIPNLFAAMNSRKALNDWHSAAYYRRSTDGHGKASDCIKCGQCEHVCPQHLPIRDLLEDIAKEFEK